MQDQQSMQQQNNRQAGTTSAAAWSMNTAAGTARDANRKSVYNPMSSRGPVGQDSLATQMGQFSLGSAPKPAAAGVYNASEGPSPSMAASNWRTNSRAPSAASGLSVPQIPVKNDVYVHSGKRRKDFRQGDVISLPFHTPNTNIHTEPNDYHLGKTWLGPTFSKRRMMVVLWLFQDAMFCLPLYSFGERGITAKVENLQKDYVCMKNVDDNDFLNEGAYDPVEIKAYKKPMSPETTVQLTGGMRIMFCEDIAPVGRLTQKSHRHLVALWEDRNQVAMNEGRQA